MLGYTFRNFISLTHSRFFKIPAVISAFFLLSLSTTAVYSQALERISSVSRSDGKGYVVRLHLTQPPDSFTVRQPDPQLIQVGIYGGEYDTTGILFPESSISGKAYHVYMLPNGIGIDIDLEENIYLEANAYPDANKKHLLVNLSHSNENRVKLIANQTNKIDWIKLSTPKDALEVNPPTLDRAYTYAKDKLKFDVVVLDPGHGGHDPGSIGGKKTREKDITLAIAKKVGKYIEENLADVKVVYTREDDRFIDLYERGPIANVAEGDLFVSIHADAFTQKNASGTTIYFLGLHKSEEAFEIMKRENSVIRPGEEAKVVQLSEQDLLVYKLANSGYISTSQHIAEIMEKQFSERARRKSRGVKQAGFVVLYYASMPALLVETGFISNPSEERFLASDYGQSIIASAIFRAIRDYKVEYESRQNGAANKK